MCDCCDDNLTNLNTGNDGQSAFLYIIYADDLIGTDAQLTVPTCFQAFVNSNVSMTNQEAIDYAIDNDLFYDRCGDSGGTGTEGPEGPAGPKGDAGDPACNPLAEISLRFRGEGEAEDLVINFDQDGTECEQTFTGQVLPGNFAASSFFSEVLASSQFDDAVATAIDAGTTLNPSITTYTYVSGDIGSKIFCVSQTGPTTAVLNTATYSGMSYIQSKIIGNTMFINFRLFLDVISASTTTLGSYYLELLIPNSKTYATNALSPIAYNLNTSTIYNLTTVISANSSSTSKLRIGGYSAAGNVGQLPSFPAYSTQTFNGSLTFSIN